MYQSCGALNRTSESVWASMSLCLPSDAGRAFLVWGEGEGWGGRAASRSFKGLRSAKEGSEMRGAGKVSRVRQYTAHVRARMRARDGGLSVRDISVSQLSAHTSRHATPHTHTTQDTRLERRGMSTARCATPPLSSSRRYHLATHAHAQHTGMSGVAAASATVGAPWALRWRRITELRAQLHETTRALQAQTARDLA